MDKIIPSNASRVSLNDRFTSILLSSKQGAENKGRRLLNRNVRNRSRSRSRSRNRNVGSGSIKNRKLVEDLEKRLKMKVAMRLKQRPVKGVAKKRLPVRRLGARGGKGRAGSVSNLTMMADVVSRARGRRSNSVSSVHSRLGQVPATRRRSQSRNRQRSVSRGRANSQVNNAVQRSGSRARSSSRARGAKRGAGFGLRRANSKASLLQNRLGVSRAGNPINKRKLNQQAARKAQNNQRNQTVNRRGVQRAARRDLSRQQVKAGQQQRGRSRSRNRAANGQNGGPKGSNKAAAQRRGRSRTRRGAPPKATKEQLDQELDSYMSSSNRNDLDDLMNGSLFR